MKNTEDLKVFAERLISTREARGLSRKQLADLVGVNIRAFAAYERHENWPAVATLAKLCEALDVSADYLLDLTDQQARSTAEPDLRPEQLENAARIESMIYTIAKIDKQQPYVRDCLPVIHDMIDRLQELQLEVGIMYDEIREQHPAFKLVIYADSKERRKLRASEGYEEGEQQYKLQLRQQINDAAVEIADMMIVDLFDQFSNKDGQ